MEHVRFGSEDHVLVVRCSDGRCEVPVCDIPPAKLHNLRLAGGILSPLLGARGNADQLPVLQAFLLDQVLVMVALKKPVAIILMAHTHCGAAEKLGIDDCGQEDRLRQFVAELNAELERQGTPLTIYAVFDEHCKHGISRVFRQVEQPHVTKLAKAA